MPNDSAAQTNAMDVLLPIANEKLRGGAFCVVFAFATPDLQSQDEVFLTGTSQSAWSLGHEVSKQTAAGREAFGFVALTDVPASGKHAICATETVLPGDEDETAARRKVILRLIQDLHSSIFCRGACPENACRMAAALRSGYRRGQ